MSYVKRFVNADKTIVGVYDESGNCLEYVHVTLDRVAEGYLDDVIDTNAIQSKPRKKGTWADLGDRLGITRYKLADKKDSGNDL